AATAPPLGGRPGGARAAPAGLSGGARGGLPGCRCRADSARGARIMTAVAELEGRVRQLWRVPKRISLSAWADGHFVLPEGDANAGRWRTLPYQRGILDAISDPTIERVSVMKSSRIGYTKGCLCVPVGYHIAHDPAAILIVQPTIDDAKKHSKEDIA